MTSASASLPSTLSWENGTLIMLDQTQLPGTVLLEPQQTVEQVWDSIKRLKVRGAPAIGIAGAYGLLVGLQPFRTLDAAAFRDKAAELARYLDSSRPTAVNLNWALNRMIQALQQSPQTDTAALYQLLEQEAIAIHEEDRKLCRGIGEHGRPLITEGCGVLTHCNAGALATSELGTATAPMYLAHAAGTRFRVYADETRPLLQGARLTSWELHQSGLNVTLITDNMAAATMAEGLIDLVIVGTDRVAANGDVANKIGTLGVAILAQHYQIPFYVACPSSTIDLNTASGAEIVIEERDPEEVRNFGERSTAPADVPVRNPAFDVTPHELVTGIITEKGLISPPYSSQLQAHFGA